MLHQRSLSFQHLRSPLSRSYTKVIPGGSRKFFRPPANTASPIQFLSNYSILHQRAAGGPSKKMLHQRSLSFQKPKSPLSRSCTKLISRGSREFFKPPVTTLSPSQFLGPTTVSYTNVLPEALEKIWYIRGPCLSSISKDPCQDPTPR